MNELWIVRFVRKDGKPDDNSGLYERIEIINDKH